LGGRGRTTTFGTTPEFGEALGRCRSRRWITADSEDLPQDLPVLSLSRAAVLDSSDTKRSDDVVIEVADG
jgi:hypothetical protein